MAKKRIMFKLVPAEETERLFKSLPREESKICFTEEEFNKDYKSMRDPLMRKMSEEYHDAYKLKGLPAQTHHLVFALNEIVGMKDRVAIVTRGPMGGVGHAMTVIKHLGAKGDVHKLRVLDPIDGRIKDKEFNFKAYFKGGDGLFFSSALEKEFLKEFNETGINKIDFMRERYSLPEIELPIKQEGLDCVFASVYAGHILHKYGRGLTNDEVKKKRKARERRLRR